MRVQVIGAGIAGLTAAFELARRNVEVELVERREGPGLGCSYYAGGMIAPWCEREAAEPIVTELGVEALDFWTKTLPVAQTNGSLVVAPPRDKPDVVSFARRTSEFEECDGARIGEIEPDLANRFPYGLFFAREAHLEPREATQALARELAGMANARMHFGRESLGDEAGFDWTIDCRGFAAKAQLPGLRGVKGEMLVLRTKDVSLSRPVRMLHPRRPVYIVPRSDPHEYMVGASMVENEEPGRITARAMMELLGSAYTVHPAFAEAEIVEIGGDVRPTYPDNLPRITKRGRTIAINGLYRHGFLLSPALASRAADIVTKDAHFPELMQ
ncbi:MAG: FAD-dependent oxidoreductase [Hyphomicrobiales bacterium]|nr:FAD-dependent oxidoreductase [Hyphomicrobiales bacterium]